MSSKWVYQFNEGDKSMRNLLGGKGANLAEMTGIGLPVPPGLHDHHRGLQPLLGARRATREGVDEQVAAALAALEADTGKKFGDATDPLLLCVRSGARASMPGMMDTILNLGLNDATVQGVIATTGNPRFAYDCYRRFVSMYGDVVLGCKPEHEDERDPFEEILEAVKEAKGIQYDTELDEDDLKDLVVKFKAAVKQRTGNDFPDDPLRAALGRHHARSSAAGTTTAPSPIAASTTSPTPGAPPSTCRPWCTATPARSPAPASPSLATPPPARTSSTASSS